MENEARRKNIEVDGAAYVLVLLPNYQDLEVIAIMEKDNKEVARKKFSPIQKDMAVSDWMKSVHTAPARMQLMLDELESWDGHITSDFYEY
ncbi:hypothetical protein HBP99_05735 [Listeria booriae]|uniref:hypothetical protein n=1 Tax=Listeria booriae TaxID=1552123 RepID=UPI001626EB76|nr:hypothetical protein [Listeria booriae]MBC2368126.1 hypothetical protein [Listeria booriae]